jgi:hypothetical protein
MLRYTNLESISGYLLPQHVQEDGSVALGMQTLTDGTSISRVISEAINGHVDIAKEDWLIMLGLDKVKTPLFHAMILSGTPVKESLEFLNRPIIKYALKEMNRGIIQSEIHYDKATLANRKASNILEGLLYKFIYTDTAAGKKANELVRENTKNGKKPSMNTLTTAILTYPNFKKAFFSEESTVGKDIASLAMLQNLRERQSKIQQLNSLVDYNTKSYQSSYQKEAEETTYAMVKNSFNESGLASLTKTSALSAFNVANTVSGLLDKAFPVTGHRMVFNAINRYANRAGLFTQDDLVKAARTVKDNLILATIHQEAVDQDGKRVFEKVFGQEGFVTKNNENNLVARLKALKESYPDIQSNLVVENLYEEKVSVATPYIIFKLKNANLDKYLINEYEKAFLKGMNDVRPEVSQFFKDLGIANFMQFGYSSNAYGLNQIVPFEVYVDYTTQAEQSIKANLESEDYVKGMTEYLAEMTYINESFELPHRFFDLNYLKRDYPSVYGNRSNFNIDLGEIAENLQQGATTQPTTQPTEVTTTNQPKGVEVKAGIFVNEGAISQEEQLELFNYLKPFLEEQAAKTNKGKYASKMIGLGLRWDYKSNNPGKTAVNIPDVISPSNKTKYGYYTESINNQPLGTITNRFREIIGKATGLDMSLYDGAIINLYDNDSFISSHNDVDESRSAINYPVVGINLGGTGNFSIESRDGSPMQLNLDAGTAYVFGVNGVNREVFHRTFPTAQASFLPELTTKLDNKTYEAGSYRVTITMRRVMPLEQSLPNNPNNSLGFEEESCEIG